MLVLPRGSWIGSVRSFRPAVVIGRLEDDEHLVEGDEVGDADPHLVHDRVKRGARRREPESTVRYVRSTWLSKFVRSETQEFALGAGQTEKIENVAGREADVLQQADHVADSETERAADGRGDV